MTINLKLDSVAFAYNQQPILSNINFQLNSGEIACLLGPSGCGKSTLLRLIAGFEKLATGQIHIANKLVSDKLNWVDPHNRDIGMLFQDLALFPHLNVTQNIAFGLHQLKNHSKKQRVDELLQLCRLEKLQSRYPHQLSGGQSQRVALARAMAPKPKLILLDEPFSSIDSGLQSELVNEVKNMLKADQSTSLWVTHNLGEAFAVADQIGVMLNGKLLQWSKPESIYNTPAHPDVVRFLNHANLVNGKITNDKMTKTPIGILNLSKPSNFKINDSVQVAINKNNISLNLNGQNNATVTDCTYLGGQYQITANLAFSDDYIQFYHQEPLQNQRKICLKIDNQISFEAFLLS